MVIKLRERVIEVLHPARVVVRVDQPGDDGRELCLVDTADRVPARYETDHLADVETLLRERRRVRREVLLGLGDTKGTGASGIDATNAHRNRGAGADTDRENRAESNEIGH